MASSSSSSLALLLAFAVCLFHFPLAAYSDHHSHTHAPAPSVDCTSLIATNLIDCLSFVTNGSTDTKPAGKCCPGLKSLLNAAPSCLCEGFKNSAQYGIALNLSRAATLPSVCKISAPPSVTNCALSQAPAGAPGLSPTSAATPSGASNVQTPAPTPSPGNSASSVLPISAASLLLCLLLPAIFSGF